MLRQPARQPSLRPVGSPTLSPRQFARLAGLIERTAGIRMPPEKRLMLQSRLDKRLRLLKLDSFDAYVDLLFSAPDGAQELQPMIDLVTTNKTDFFREPHHFEHLVRHGLADLVALHGRRLRLWSAPCSMGHEVYTLAMVLQDWADGHGGLDFEVLGSDLSTQALAVARRAVYPHAEIAPVPPDWRSRYLLRARDGQADTVRIAPDLRSRTRWQHQNFMDSRYAVDGRFHTIFCRNMLIYFDPPTQQAVVSRLVSHLLPGGLFFTGHAETLGRLRTPLVQLQPTIYQLPA